ncbi:hypothetical protein B7755_026135 [Streptomyces sp. NBS 14/10]|uniref:hypothetical protein n=1 Tax=Streptomyces sp. NBS 14/10 TaxID=1945643 RepID=UPI00273063DD|nr:hypothetical protein [Streptomyces sp. NBS 14/10]KAK1181312.1 hypothetical protein B7755_026135 [Streptomyces sp. NBS 14/10]
MSITAFATRRARTLRLAAIGLTAVAALTLTACNSDEGTGTKNEGKAEHSDQRFNAAGGAKKGSDGSEQEIGPCDINKLTVGVKSVQRPVNYMVLEVNTAAPSTSTTPPRSPTGRATCPTPSTNPSD